jgi:hypothetical protein
MKWAEYYDEKTLRQTIQKLKPNNELFEVRIISKGNRKRIISGYFTSIDTLIQQFDTIDPRNTNMYITINKVNEDCYSRAQHDCFRQTDTNTQDSEIEAYEWLFIDLDPIRVTDISSSDKELEASKVLCDKVYDYMKGLGFKEPIRAMSGNGYHLLYKIALDNTEENVSLVERCLYNLSAMFSNEVVKIDVVNYNPSRICKLYGTLAQKGANTQKRPHRMAQIISMPGVVESNTTDLLQVLANELPEPPKPQRNNNSTSYSSNGDFDIETWMYEHGLESIGAKSGKDCVIYPLANCPFDHSHTNGDSKIFKYTNGAIAFKCHHNSCRGKNWQDVRELLEPGAYDAKQLNAEDDARIEAGYQQHKALKVAKPEQIAENKKPKQLRRLKTAEALMKKDLPEPEVFVGVGDELPILVEGTCILSAKPKLGKSWLALSMCVAVANGEDFLGYHTKQCSTLYLDLETSETLQQRRLKKVLKGANPPKNFYLETETDQIGKGFIEQIEDYLRQDPKIGIVVIDVFQIIRSPSANMKESEYEHAYRDITPLNELAQKHHISIMLVCHDRKAVDPDDPFSNILGSTGLQGAATQMMVMFRKKKEDPIHISIKGKTIDGLPELNVKLDNAEWSIVDGVNLRERELQQANDEYMNSDIRAAVIAIAEQNNSYKGSCSGIIKTAVEDCGKGLLVEPKDVGKFLHKHQGRFLKVDNIKITIIDNGTGPKLYRIQKFTIDTIDENKQVTIDEFIDASNFKASDIPFL